MLWMIVDYKRRKEMTNEEFDKEMQRHQRETELMRLMTSYTKEELSYGKIGLFTNAATRARVAQLQRFYREADTELKKLRSGK